MPVMRGAFFQCAKCGGLRQYGVDAPSDEYKPLICCEYCKKLTRHTFHSDRDLTDYEKREIAKQLRPIRMIPGARMAGVVQ